jgi:hypothetical protein
VTGGYIAAYAATAYFMAGFDVIFNVTAVYGMARLGIAADKAFAFKGMARNGRADNVPLYRKGMVAVNIKGFAGKGNVTLEVVPVAVADKTSSFEHRNSYTAVVLPFY